MLALSQGEKEGSTVHGLQSLDYAREHWIPTAKPVCRQTIYRWWRHGLNGVRLRTVCVGRQRMTKESWLNRFFEEVAEADLAHEASTMGPDSDIDYASVGL